MKKKPRILVVEDHVSIARNIVQGLTQESYEAMAVHDGETGLSEAKQGNYDLLIFDIGLPKKDGVMLTRELRKRGITTPILLLTAREEVSQKIVGLDAGADDYLVKPFDFDELLARARALLRRKQQFSITDSGTLNIGDLMLDIDAHKVTRGKSEVNLAPREFDLLTYLMQNTGKAISRLNLLENVWGATADDQYTSDTVDVHISYLRKKIDRNAKIKLIKTVKGVGYKIEI